MIHPAEPKSRRVANWARESTRAIQERDEPQIGGVLTYVNEAGHRMEVQLADVSAREVLPFLAICHENCWDYEGGGDGGSNPQPTWNVRLKQIEAYYGDGVGSAEVEWRFSKGGTTTTVRIEGLDHGSSTWSHDVQIRNTIIWASHNEPTGTISVSAKETDAGSDDPWGNGTVGVGWSAGQPVTHTGSTTQFCTEIGDPDTSGCHHTLDYGNSTPTSAFQVRAEYIPPPQ